MRAILDATADGSLDARVVVVVSDRPSAPALEIAASHGIPTAVVDARALRSGDVAADRERFDRALAVVLDAHAAELVVLAGFMRILGARLVDAYAGRMVNIHPSLLPAYPGLDTHARAIAAGDREHGASVHLVTAELDAGPVLGQVRVPILDDDTPERLAGRVLEQEHTLYVETLARLVNARTAAATPNTDTAAAYTRPHPGTEPRPRTRFRAPGRVRDHEADGNS